jgi:hypothetical protein
MPLSIHEMPNSDREKLEDEIHKNNSTVEDRSDVSGIKIILRIDMLTAQDRSVEGGKPGRGDRNAAGERKAYSRQDMKRS